MLNIDLTDKSVTELLVEAEARILLAKLKHDPLRHGPIFNALSVGLEQIQRAQHLRMLAKKDPVQNIHDQLRAMPLIDNKSKGAGPDQ